MVWPGTARAGWPVLEVEEVIFGLCPRGLRHQTLGISETGLVVWQRPSHAQNSSLHSVHLLR